MLRLADKPVRAIMTPRTEIAWIDRAATHADIVARIKGNAHSRFVVGDGTVDNVVGVVQAKDMLDRLLSGGTLSLDDAMRQPMIVPDAISALDALERLKGDANGMALVIDEYGSFEGLITAADMLEAIVGDSDDTAAEARGRATDSPHAANFVFDGLMPLDELTEKLSLGNLPAPGTYHTAAGLILALLRRVPQTGDALLFGGLALRGCSAWMAGVWTSCVWNARARSHRDGRC